MEDIKKMLENNLFWIIYPKDKTKESAEKLAAMLESTAGIAEL